MLDKTIGVQAIKLTGMRGEITGVCRNQVPRPSNDRVSQRRPPKIEIEDVDTNSDNDDNTDHPDTGTPPRLMSCRYKDINSNDKKNDNDGFEMSNIDGRDVVTRQNESYATNLIPLGKDVTQESRGGRGHTRR